MEIEKLEEQLKKMMNAWEKKLGGRRTASEVWKTDFIRVKTLVTGCKSNFNIIFFL